MLTKVKQWHWLAARFAGVAMLGLLSACAALSPADKTTSDRLRAFPTKGAPVQRPVSIAWNDHQVPFIEAQNDRDLAVALGMVHAHLRLGQMTLMRHISQGRLSEIAGPPARDIDHALRILDFGHAVPDIIANMDRRTRDWLEGFVAGINFYQRHAPKPPPEFALLGLSPQPWTLGDVLTVGRLAGTEVNWLAYFSLLPRRDYPDWPAQWRRALVAGGRSPGGDAGTPLSRTEAQREALSSLLQSFSENGSNSLALAPEHSASGGALIANDPHLGLLTPNLWLLAGVESPSYHMVGMMIPGLPFMALGRSQHLAWGGTNLRALTSDLYDVSGLPRDAISERETTIGTRFWFDETRQVRRSPLGPILSDSALIPAREGEEIALRWTGHDPSQEIAAFLQANRATDIDAFRAAFADYAVSAQNLVVAGKDGRIAKLLAVRLPRRPYAADGPPERLVLDGADPAQRWDGFDTALDLPWLSDPDEGYVASANDRPRFADRALGYFFGSDDRMAKLRSVAERGGRFTVADLMALQRDVSAPGAKALAKELLAEARTLGLDEAAPLPEIAAWDGRYGTDSRGAVAFETLLYHLAHALYAEGDERTVPRLFADWGHLQTFLLADLRALETAKRRVVFRYALERAASDAAAFADWGAMHRMRISHWLSNLPLVGGRFDYRDYPVAGSRETLMKTSHGLVRQRHDTSYGAQARHISDMSDPDANYFVLLGGQDGWLGSANLIDQVALWRAGDYIQMPLSKPGRARLFDRTLTVRPAATGAARAGG